MLSENKNYYKGPELREWQKQAIKFWNVNHKGIIQAVPGSGKTFLAIKLFSDILKKENIKVLIVCPRLSLIEQWKQVIVENSLFKKEDIYEISSKTEIQAHKKVQSILHKHKIFISTFNQIKQFFSHNEWKQENWFLIVDEMHNTTEGYKFPNEIKYKLGLSATPKKKGKNSDFNLGGIIYTYSFKQALENNIILDPEFKLILYSVNEPVFKKIQNKENSTEELLDDAYDSILSAEENHDEYFEDIEEDTNKEDKKAKVFNETNTDFIGIQKILENKFFLGKEGAQQTLVFVNRIKKANILNEILLSQFNEKISHSHHSQSEGYLKKNHFTKLKNKFAEGKFKVLISVSALGEGIDFPYASHGIIASPIYNPTNFIQKVGRLLRTYSNHKKAVIYYYIPSELITRILTDESLSPNYLKEVLKIASERKNLYFVDRETLKEEKADFEDLIVQGAAYERNSEIKMLKVPSHIDLILRFSKKLFPESFKHWRTYCEENDYTGLEERIIQHSKILLRCTKNLIHNLEKVNFLQKEFENKEFNGYEEIKKFVREGVKHNFVIKIKHGAELKEDIDDSEKQLLKNAIKAELKEFIKKRKTLKKQISNLKKLLDEFEEKNDKEKLQTLNKIAGTFFKLQSNYLDQLELITISKNFESEGAVITFGKDIFVMAQNKRAYSYPEDFGLSRWKIEEEKKPEPDPKENLFLKELIKENDEGKIKNKEQLDKAIQKFNKLYKTKLDLNTIQNLLDEMKSNPKFSLIEILSLKDTIDSLNKD
jgi:superfamily II DNA or RNA helicase